jgi:hypothetical protein
MTRLPRATGPELIAALERDCDLTAEQLEALL